MKSGTWGQTEPGKPNYTGTNEVLYDGYLGYMPTFKDDLNDYNATVGVK